MNGDSLLDCLFMSKMWINYGWKHVVQPYYVYRKKIVMYFRYIVKAMLLQCYYFQHYFNWSFREFFYLRLRLFKTYKVTIMSRWVSFKYEFTLNHVTASFSVIDCYFDWFYFLNKKLCHDTFSSIIGILIASFIY